MMIYPFTQGFAAVMQFLLCLRFLHKLPENRKDTIM